MLIARVIINISLDQVFDYSVPAELMNKVKTGSQVKVPFGNSFRQGFVLSIADHTTFKGKLKNVIGLADEQPEIPDELIHLGEWMADYYCCSREQSVRNLLPGAVRSGKIKRKQESIYYPVETEKAEEFIIVHGKQSKAKARILKVLLQHSGITSKQLLKDAEAGAASLKGLVKSGLVTEDKRSVQRDPYEDVEILMDVPKKLTDEQALALEKILELMKGEAEQHVALLHGITGSGKTEVYLQAISKCLESGKESIVLVPEISLTPQTVRRFRARFGDMVSVLHSRLTPGERYDEWMKVHEGQVKIAVGARSALFAPFKNPGLIIVDEEHEGSYKQSEAPRYHARDVAVMRGYREKAVVVLGSATPSFESYRNALEGKYLLLELNNRVDNFDLPVMRLVDMRMETQDDGKVGFFSKELVQAVYQRISAREQVILFLNRRGFARQMMCEHCGFVAECPECSVSYTYHRKNEHLSCHLCGGVINAYRACPECGAEDIRYSGVGTEKIESTARKLFPSARIERMDSDSMRTHGAYERVLNGFLKGDIDILIGTQMIAKGLHFPKVTLVGVINADQGLYVPDFRSEERTFQLLTQVAGRAGREELRGEVLIQTFNPYNETIQFALKHQFRGFYDYDMEVREELLYPPCAHLIAVHIRGEDISVIESFAAEFLAQLQPAITPEMKVVGPVPAPIEKIKNKYRYQIIFRGKKLTYFRRFLREMVLHSKLPRGIEMYVDVDALSLM